MRELGFTLDQFNRVLKLEGSSIFVTAITFDPRRGPSGCYVVATSSGEEMIIPNPEVGWRSEESHPLSSIIRKLLSQPRCAIDTKARIANSLRYTKRHFVRTLAYARA